MGVRAFRAHHFCGKGLRIVLMILRFAGLALVVAAVTGGAHAQGALYLNPMVTRVSNSTIDTGAFSFP